MYYNLRQCVIIFFPINIDPSGVPRAIARVSLSKSLMSIIELFVQTMLKEHQTCLPQKPYPIQTFFTFVYHHFQSLCLLLGSCVYVNKSNCLLPPQLWG